MTHSDAELPADCSNSDNNLSGCGGGSRRGQCGDLTPITFTFLDWKLTNRDRDRALAQAAAPAIDIQMCLLTVKYYFHKMPSSDPM